MNKGQKGKEVENKAGQPLEVPPQPNKIYHKKKDLKVGETYFCRLSGNPMMVTEVSETEATALMYRRVAESYTSVDIADNQLFLFEGISSQV